MEKRGNQKIINILLRGLLTDNKSRKYVVKGPHNQRRRERGEGRKGKEEKERERERERKNKAKIGIIPLAHDL